jgi:ribosomal protein S18 acetylase RimI-like enzyme
VTVPGRSERLAGRDAVLAAGDHPYVRLSAVGEVTGYRSAAALAWRGSGPSGTWVAAVGDPLAALDLIRDTRLDAGVEWVHLPRLPTGLVAPLAPSIHDDWDFLTTRSAPPDGAVGFAVRLLDVADHPVVDALLDAAFPRSTARPEDARVRRWYGVHDDEGELIATAADRSRGGVGHVSAVAVHPAHRRRGLGSAVTAVLTRALLAEFPVVTLGVMADDGGTRRLYERLGYGEHLQRTSLRLSR